MIAGPAPGRAADRARTVFLGSGTFAVPILDALAAHPRIELAAIVTAPDRPAGRHHALTATPVARRARELGAPILQPERVRAAESIAQIAALQPDLGVLADYGQIIPKALLDLPRLGILNVHPSMLPRHRGATPIQAAIAAGDPRTGVTIIRMDEGVDTGPIVATVGWAMTGFERAPDLEDFAADQAADLLQRRLGAWLDGDLLPRAQGEVGASVTRILRREDGRLDPERSAVELARQVRAYVPWPGSFIDLASGRVAVLAARAVPSEPGDVPGMLVRHEDGLALTTGDGRLGLDEVQPAGGRSMSGEAFVRGHGARVGSIVAGHDTKAGAESRAPQPASHP